MSGIVAAGPALANILLGLYDAQNRVLLEVNVDGSVVFGPNYSQEVAARVLWQNLEAYNPLAAEVDDLCAQLSILRAELIGAQNELAAAKACIDAMIAERSDE